MRTLWQGTMLKQNQVGPKRKNSPELGLVSERIDIQCSYGKCYELETNTMGSFVRNLSQRIII